jgi:hypothetical protein
MTTPYKDEQHQGDTMSDDRTNNPPDPPEADDDEIGADWDEMADWPLEGDEVEEDEEEW